MLLFFLPIYTQHFLIMPVLMVNTKLNPPLAIPTGTPMIVTNEPMLTVPNEAESIIKTVST